MRKSGSLKRSSTTAKRAGIVAVIDECFIEFLNEEKADVPVSGISGGRKELPENGERYFSSGHLRETYAMAECGSAMDSARIRTCRADGRKLAAVEAYRSRPRKSGLAALSDERIPFLKKNAGAGGKGEKYSFGRTHKGGILQYSIRRRIFLLFKDFKTEQESWLYEFFLEHGILIGPAKTTGNSIRDITGSASGRTRNSLLSFWRS